jgi:hypothetical protein
MSVTLVCGGLLAGTQARACADAATVATSRRLGAEAGGLAAAGDFAGALERYRAALTALPVSPACESPRGELQGLIARCLERLCRLEEALALHRTRLGTPGVVAKGHLLIQPGTGVEGAVVRGPDASTVEARCANGYLLPPGEYRVDARTAGGPVERTVQVTAGQTTSLTLEAPPVPPPPVASPPPEVVVVTPPREVDDAPCTTCRTWAWAGVITAGAATLGAGIAYGAALGADEEMNDAAARQRRLAGARPPDVEGAALAARQAEDARDTRDALRPVTYALVGIGLASVALAVVMFQLAPEAPGTPAPADGPALGFRF